MPLRTLQPIGDPQLVPDEASPIGYCHVCGGELWSTDDDALEVDDVMVFRYGDCHKDYTEDLAAENTTLRLRIMWHLQGIKDIGHV